MFENLTPLDIVHPLIACVIVIFSVMPFRKLARVMGIVDKPDDRKKHAKAIPPIGGLVIFIVFMAYGLLSGAVNLHSYWPLYSSLIILLVSGAIDDQFSLNAWLKMFIHIAAAAVIAFLGNVQAAYLGDLFGFGVIWTGFLSYPFTLVALVLLINAMNLMDGMDGVAGGIASVIFAWFAVAAAMAGWFDYTKVLALLVGCLVGFLWFNIRNPWRRQASLFLGDAGSMSLGLSIGWFAVHLARGPETPLEPIAVAWIIGFPIFDTCAQFFRRACEKKDPFGPDRHHFHHHFIDAGIPVKYAAPMIIGVVAVMGAIGVGGTALGVPPVVLTIGWVALFFAHIAMSRKPERYVRLISRLAGKLSN